MILRVLALCVASVVANSAFATTDVAPTDPRPLAVLITEDPWAMVAGADSPSFVLYDNGEVIYFDSAAVPARHRIVQLAPAELVEFEKKLVSFAPAVGRKSYLELSRWTDQPTTRLYVDVDGKPRTVSIYGELNDNAEQPGVPPADAPPLDALPADLEMLVALLSQFRRDTARDWIPAQLEVYAWDYDYAPDPSIHWPAQWPGLDAPTSVQHDDAVSIFLPGDQKQALVDFLQARKERGAVEIGGRKWAVSFWPVFPGSAAWAKRTPSDAADDD
jgi:hypothetical protein